MLDQLDGPIASFTGDGAYDQEGVYAGVAARHPEAAVIVPPRSSAVPSDTAETAPTQRDQHLQAIAETGRMGWQKASGYNLRARVEAAVSRYKRVIGDTLRSQTDGRQATEVAIAVGVLNRMLELGRPESVRISVVHGSGAWTQCAQPRLGSSRCGQIRASQLQHAVERWTATSTSVARRSSVRARSPSPITCFHRPMAASARARMLYPDAFCQPMRPSRRCLQMPVALRRRRLRRRRSAPRSNAVAR